MRPIDADTLLEKVEKIQPWEPYLGKYAQGIRHCMELVSLLIKDAPTIEPSAQPEQLTDNEKRIFLAAMAREELICLQFDEECNDPNSVNLVEICHEITRKVKGALWTI